jgi:16S rRNA (cytosine1402-N4)-methyltransferase
MSAGRTSSQGAGGPARHVPVLLPEMLQSLAVVEGERYIDGSFGAGGYSRAILEMGGTVLAIDRDRAAVEAGAELVARSGGRLILVEGRFSDMEAFARNAGFAPADGVVLDVGVSSMQLDDAERGFSFRRDGPLDMRMGHAGPDAAAIVNRASAKELAAILRVFGEERQAGRVARAVVRARAAAPIVRTAQLAEIVAAATGSAGATRIHPATRTFQALRIFINRELRSWRWPSPPPRRCCARAAGWSSWRSTRLRTASSSASCRSAAKRRAARAISPPPLPRPPLSRC